MRRRSLSVPGLLSLLVATSCVRVRTVEDEQAQSQSAEARDDGADARRSAAARGDAPSEAAASRGSVEAPRHPVEIAAPVPRLTPEVTLLSAGDEPRAALRLRPSPGAREVATLRMGMVVAMQIGSTDVPPRRIPSIEAKLEAVVLDAEDDRIRYRIETLAVEAGEPGDVSARVQEAVQRAVESMRGTKGTIVVSSRGRIERSDLEIPAEDDASLRPTLEGFRQSFNQMFAWLPEGPVGTGARWRAITHFEQNELEIQQTAEYHLVARDGDRVELEYQLTQRAVDGDSVRTPLPGGSLEVEGHAATGSGRVVLDLGRVMPMSGDAESAGATRTKVAMGGAPEAVLLELALDLSLQSP
jgi:tRNA threonylcarbamoyladenosine modification (KEOPS) complex  Pcc1 subunit